MERKLLENQGVTTKRGGGRYAPQKESLPAAIVCCTKRPSPWIRAPRGGMKAKSYRTTAHTGCEPELRLQPLSQGRRQRAQPRKASLHSTGAEAAGKEPPGLCHRSPTRPCAQVSPCDKAWVCPTPQGCRAMPTHLPTVQAKQFHSSRALAGAAPPALEPPKPGSSRARVPAGLTSSSGPARGCAVEQPACAGGVSPQEAVAEVTMA